MIGKVQTAYREEAYNYKVKMVILHKLEMTLEHFRQLFRVRKEKEDKNPRVLMQLLKDLLDKCLLLVLVEKY